MMRQDRFTEQAQKVLSASQELVRRNRQSQWDVEHVLLALATEGGLAAQIFEALEVDTKRLAGQAEASLEAAPKLAQDVVQVYTTPRVVKMLERANAEAERLKDEYVGVEHLLIAITAISAITTTRRSRRRTDSRSKAALTRTDLLAEEWETASGLIEIQTQAVAVPCHVGERAMARGEVELDITDALGCTVCTLRLMEHPAIRQGRDDPMLCVGNRVQ